MARGGERGEVPCYGSVIDLDMRCTIKRLPEIDESGPGVPGLSGFELLNYSYCVTNYVFGCTGRNADSAPRRLREQDSSAGVAS